MSEQYLRKCILTVESDSLITDLSQMRIKFAIKQADIQTPNYAVIRIYNLSETTAQSVQDEFKHVTLQAGYQDTAAFGVIFQGQIKQVRRGRENPTDTYLDILASDGLIGLSMAVMNETLAAGSTAADHLQAAQNSLKQYGINPGFVGHMDTTALPRGKVLYGMTRDQLRVLGASQGMTYSIQNGQLIVIPLAGVRPGQAVVCNSTTGVIGIPEQTEGGIKLKMLLNPQLEIGSTLQINEKDIQLAQVPPGTTTTSDFYKTQIGQLAKNDGLYRAYVIEHTGDTRGNDWYSDVTCLALDPTLQGVLQRSTLTLRGFV